MKKITALCLLGLLAFPAVGKTPVKHKKNVELLTSVAAAVENAQYPAVRVGSYDFRLKEITRGVDEKGKLFFRYIYKPVGLAVYDEEVKYGEVDEMGNQAFYVTGYEINDNLFAPQSAQFVPFEVKRVDVTVYPNNRMKKTLRHWEKGYGVTAEDCIERSEQDGMQVAALKNDLIKAYTLKDGRTLVVKVWAENDRYGSYQRECGDTLFGKLFGKQPQFTQAELTEFADKVFPVK